MKLTLAAINGLNKKFQMYSFIFKFFLMFLRAYNADRAIAAFDGGLRLEIRGSALHDGMDCLFKNKH